jgi:hypothetical protein
MALILAAPLLTVARLILSRGAGQASKKYGPKLIKKTKDYISNNKLIWDGKKIIKPKPSSIKTVKPTKTTTKTDSGGVKEVQKKYNFDPKKIAAGKNDKLVNKKADDIINKVKNSPNDGEKLLNNLDKSGNLFNFYIKGKFKNNRVFKKSIKDTLNNKNIKNNTTKKIDDTKLTSNVNKTPTMISTILGKAKKHPFATGMVVIPASMGLVNKASDMIKNMGGKTEAKTFGQAFREARKDKGPDAVFTYKGKQYSTVTEDQYKKAGFNSLSEYLNSKKNK